MTSIHIRTFGCSANFSDSEAMAGLLRQAQFEIVGNPDDAFLVVLNLCTVKGSAVALKRVRQFREEFPHKKLVVTGCISKDLVKPLRELVPDASLVSTHSIREIASAVEETLHDNPIFMLKKKSKGWPKINMPKVRKNPIVGIVPIASGCLGGCSYCSVRMIKGRLNSYPAECIVEEVRQCVADGCREIWITGQDTGCYGMDLKPKSSLPELLKQVLAVKGDFFVRLGMANPNFVLKMTDELVEIYKNPKMFKFLHIPVQSGSDEILKTMNRPYTVDEFRQIVKRFKKEIPEMTFSTDIICGFPNETKEQFMQSVALVKEIMPDVLNISRFVPRRGTLAAKMEGQLQISEKKERSAYLAEVHKWVAFERNRLWRNWKGEIIIDEISAKNNAIFGRNSAYKIFTAEGNFKLGQKINVKVVSMSPHCLIAQTLE
jgi:MiaB-like tRNA modifying enzyme